MHLYNLPILKVPQRIRHLVSQHRKNSKVSRLQATSIQSNIFYSCCIISEDAFYLRKIELDSGERLEKQIKVSKVKIREVILRLRWLILILSDRDFGCIQTQHIFQKSTLSSILLEKQDFTLFSADSKTVLQSRDFMRFLNIQDELILVEMIDNSIIFNKIPCNSSKTLKLSAFDLECSRNDKIVEFAVNHQQLFNQNCQNQLVLAVVKIHTQNDDYKYFLIQLLWKQSKYVHHFLYTHQSQEQNSTQKMRITTFSQLYIIIYTSQYLVFCKRWEQGIHVYGLMPIQLNVKDIIGIQNESKYQLTLLMAVRSQNSTVVYCYDLMQLLKKMALSPILIHSDGDLTDQVMGFMKLSTGYPLLVLSKETYAILPTILKLYSIIIKVQVQEQEEEALDLEDEDYLFSEETKRKQVHFLPFPIFRTKLHEQKQIQEGIDELFMRNKMSPKILNFQSLLEQSIGCLKGDNYICLNALFREYAYVFIYLLHFLKYVQSQNASCKPQFIINQSFLIQECKIAFEKNFISTPMMEQPKIDAQVRKKIVSMKDNLFGVLTLFRKTFQNELFCPKKSNFQYFQILKDLSLNEIIQFLIDKIQLVDYLAFLVYKAGINGNEQEWKISRNILRKLLQTRQDYPPLIGLLAGDAKIYAASYHHLDVCKILREREVIDLKQFSNLPSLKHNGIYAAKYLKKVGFQHLLSFVPDQYQVQKYDGNFVFLNIPKKYSDFTFSLLKEETVQIREKVYLMLTQQNIVKSMEHMETRISLQFLPHSRCQTFVFSQKLKILNQVFVQKLSKCFNQKKVQRQKRKQQMNQMKFDCQCFDNSQYEQIIQAKDLKVKPSKISQLIEVVNHHQSVLIQKFYYDLLQIVQNAYLSELQHFLKTKVLKKTQSVIIAAQQQRLQISKILQKPKYKAEQSNKEQLYEILLKNLCNLPQKLAYFSEKYQIEFQDELSYSNFSQCYIQILHFLSSKVQSSKRPQIEQISENKQLKTFSLQKLRKRALQRKNIDFKIKSFANLKNYEKWILIDLTRSELLQKVFAASRLWIYSFEDLAIQSALNSINLSFAGQTILSALIQINEF